MDIGSTSHVTSRKDFFSSYTPGDCGTLSMGNETVSRGLALVQFVWKLVLELTRFEQCETWS